MKQPQAKRAKEQQESRQPSSNKSIKGEEAGLLRVESSEQREEKVAVEKQALQH